MWRLAHYSVSFGTENLKNCWDVDPLEAVQQLGFQTLFRASGMKESLMVLTTGD